MGITLTNFVITVTGGSQSDPYTMADLLASGTTSNQIATGGYGGKKFTVTGADLVIGSTLGDTYFDITSSIIEMDSGQFLTVYTSALRGATMGSTFSARLSDGGLVPFISENLRKSRIENVRRLYLEKMYNLDNTSGLWVRDGREPKIVAVAVNGEVT